MSTYIILLAAYLIGSISFALLIGKKTKGIDIRTSGSGNLGATNAFRVLGAKVGTFVLMGDVLKGTLATSLPVLFSAPIDPVWAGVVAVIGHCYPIYTKFQGGKAVATSGGVILFLDPTLFMSSILCFLLVLTLFKMVSLASILSSMCAAAYASQMASQTLFVALIFLAVFIVFRHRMNLVRIVNGTEPKVTIFKRRQTR